ncbi:GIY-YIG nuclease family protein [Streptomyces asiaticus]|uniref:GIY-YIG nuclease family protein n=1 Tax=Streptomyces asiaticus TaxID=114695 RepID=UPI003817D961
MNAQSDAKFVDDFEARFPSISPAQEPEELAKAARKNEPRKATKPTKMRCTYLVGIEGSPLVKIGFTSGAPMKRLKSLQTGQPMTLSLLWSTPGDHEDMLHERFAKYRVRGEWFDLTPLGDPVQVVEEALRLPGEGLALPGQAAAAQTGGAQKPTSVMLDCVCGHSKGHHRYKSCTVAGWDEWLDCQCAGYTSKSVLESVGALTRVPEPRPVTNGWQGPTPPERVKAQRDFRYDYVLAEVAEMVWPGGGPMVPGDW